MNKGNFYQPTNTMKRRRTDDDDDGFDDEWGNDDDFSQAQLNEIDTLVSSQVPAGLNNNDHKPIPKTFTRPSSVNTTNDNVPKFAALNNSTSKGKLSVAKPLSSTSHASALNSQCATPNWQRQIQKLHEENVQLKNSIKSLTSNSYSNEGQVKLLKQKVQDKETEINRLRNEKIWQMEESVKMKTEYDAKMQTEIEKYKTQLHFKDQELRETYQKMKDKMLCADSAILKSPTRNDIGVRSPKTPKNSQGFPNRRTFACNEGSPRRPNTKSVGTQGSGSTSTAPETTRIIGRRRKLQLEINSNISVGSINGPHLVDKMLQSEVCLDPSKQNFTDGLLTMLYKPNSYIPQQKEKSDSSTRLHDEHPSLGTDPEKQRLARKGIETLLKSNLVDTKLSSQTQYLCNADSVLLLLPLIDEHLSTYVDSLQTKVHTEKGDTSSVESSLGAYGQSSKSGEQHSICTDKCHGVLSLLLSLVTYSGTVCKALLKSASGYVNDSDSNPETQNERRESIENKSRSNTPMPASCKAQIVSQCRIFEKLVCLADPYFNSDKPWPSQLTESSLSILALLAQQCPKSNLHVFLCLLPSESVSSPSGCAVVHCLDHPHPSVVYHVLELLSPLVQCERILTVFDENKDDVCVLTKLYDAVQQIPSKYADKMRIELKYKLISFLSVILEEKSNLERLLTKHCMCGDEVIQTISMMLHFELPQLESGDKNNVALTKKLLHAGIRLLHSFSVKDDLFRKHASEVEQYVQLMYAYESLCSEQLSDDEILSVRIHDLWIFEDIVENEEEEFMDASN